MYEQFFGLIEKPFNVTPNTQYLYSSPQHEGVIDTLLYGIKERRGFLILVGEVGTGKTTSIRALLSRLGPQTHSSLVLNPSLSTLELVKTINEDFGIRFQSDSVTAQIQALNDFLLKNYQEQKNAVVIIDEAQNLSTEALEMTRMLSNLETETDKLLQIVLVGQPELEQKLLQKELRQLAQRIQVTCRLTALEKPQVEQYVHHRIGRAGNHPNIAFEKGALKELFKLSKGVPRIINSVCELALLAAFAKDTHVITKKLVRSAAKETLAIS